VLWSSPTVTKKVVSVFVRFSCRFSCGAIKASGKYTSVFNDLDGPIILYWMEWFVIQMLELLVVFAIDSM
jgi:hypothetical protein